MAGIMPSTIIAPWFETTMPLATMLDTQAGIVAAEDALDHNGQ